MLTIVVTNDFGFFSLVTFFSFITYVLIFRVEANRLR